MVMDAPVAVLVTTAPVAFEAAGFTTPNAALLTVVPCTTVTAAVAITPLGIAVVLTPKRIQSTQPELFTQVRLFPAPVAAELAVKFTPLMVASG
jgi:hypothetical protein